MKDPIPLECKVSGMGSLFFWNYSKRQNAFTIHRTLLRPVPPHSYSERQVIFDVHYK